MTTPLVAGLSVAAAAVAARSALGYYTAWKASPRLRRVFEGGFEAVMTKREAANILAVRCALFRAARSCAPRPLRLLLPRLHLACNQSHAAHPEGRAGSLRRRRW